MVIKATFDDLPDVLRIYETARKFMADNGNPDQWANGHPRESMLIEDIEAGRKYMKTYKQMKMYNDPALNPVLYGKK